MRWVVSPFTVVTWNRGEIRIACAASGRIAACESPEILEILGAFSSETSAEEVIAALDHFEPEEVAESIKMLQELGALLPSDQTPSIWWETHDLYFHTSVALGAGATCPLFGKVDPLPAVKAPLSIKTIELTRNPAAPDYGFVDVLDNRRSVREYGNRPIAKDTISQFLWFSSRNTSHPALLEMPPVEVLQRPYPSGGSFHPLETYPVLTAGAVEGCEAGLYHYCPQRHVLEQLETDPSRCAPFLETARLAAGLERHPPILILIASKHGRMSYKYEGLTYHLTLQEVGALYQTYYLVATLLDLAPCALGSCSGSERLAELAGHDPLAEPLVGQFMLGPRRI